MAASSSSRASTKKKLLAAFLIILIIVGILMLIIYFTVIQPRSSAANSNVGRWDPSRMTHSFNSCGAGKYIALTFDDGPSVAGTPNLLRDLQKHNVKATFFVSPAVDGPPNDQQCQLIKMLIDNGHSVQSHSYDHTEFTTKSGQEVYDNLAANYAWVKKCSGRSSIDMSMFRPPFGSLTPEYASFISKLGYTLGSWNIESLDYSGGSAAQVWQNIQAGYANVASGQSVVLIMHDKHYIDGGALGVLDNVVPYFKGLGYQFVTGPDCYRQCGKDICAAQNPVWPGTWDSVY